MNVLLVIYKKKVYKMQCSQKNTCENEGFFGGVFPGGAKGSTLVVSSEIYYQKSISPADICHNSGKM